MPLSLGTLLLSLVAMAHDRSHMTLRSWLAAAAAAGVVLAVGPGSPLTTVTYAFLTAQLVGFATLLTEQLVSPAAGGEPAEITPARRCSAPASPRTRRSSSSLQPSTGAGHLAAAGQREVGQPAAALLGDREDHRSSVLGVRGALDQAELEQGPAPAG